MFYGSDSQFRFCQQREELGLGFEVLMSKPLYPKLNKYEWIEGVKKIIFIQVWEQ